MSELCGYKKGAFTGAIENYEGKLQQADGGILFLDEIGELGLEEQAMLLKVIDGAKVDTLGEKENYKKAVSFILFCATNRDLDQEVAEGRFREDLLSRINLWQYELEPLRKRTEEIIGELDKINFEDKARDKFIEFAKTAQWRGNWRDFKNTLKRLSVRGQLNKTECVSIENVQFEIEHLQSQWSKRNGNVHTDPNTVHNHELLNPLDYRNDIYYQRLCEKLGKEKIEQKHPIDILQLLAVLRICKGKKNAAETGEILYSKDKNPSSRIGKFLHKKFGLSWELARVIVSD
jgi:transcriptional regulatory protein RtcR